MGDSLGNGRPTDHFRSARTGLKLNASDPEMIGGDYPKFKNDRGLAEIRIGAKEFNCIGVSPPHDHPHIYLNMGKDDTIVCPYCSTVFRFDAGLGPNGVEPSDSLFVDEK